MRVVEAGDGGVAFQIHHFGAVAVVLHHLGDGTHFQKFSIAHGNGFRDRILAIDGVKLAVNQNEIGFTEGNHNCS